MRSLVWRTPRPGAEPMRGPQAARWYLRFFRDPIHTLQLAHAELGPVCAAGNVVPLPQREKLHVIALGPEYNHQVLGDPDRFRTTGQGIGGPRDSAQRRLRYGLTRSQRGRHARQRQFMLPPFQKKAVEGYTEKMVAVTDKLLGQWTAGSVVDVWREMRKLTLEISSDVLFAREDPAAFARARRDDRRLALARLLGPRLGLMLDLPGPAVPRPAAPRRGDRARDPGDARREASVPARRAAISSRCSSPPTSTASNG